jgi:hypothetical protein
MCASRKIFTEIWVDTRDVAILCSLDQGLYRHPVDILLSSVLDILSREQEKAAEASDFWDDNLFGHFVPKQLQAFLMPDKAIIWNQAVKPGIITVATKPAKLQFMKQ